jgi:hypothetical protein
VKQQLGRSPAYVAAKSGQVPTLQLLTEAGAKVDVKCEVFTLKIIFLFLQPTQNEEKYFLNIII